jgi:hypothetical protein
MNLMMCVVNMITLDKVMDELRLLRLRSDNSVHVDNC